LNKLKRRLKQLSQYAQVVNTNILNTPHATWFQSNDDDGFLQPFSLVTTNVGAVNVGILGFMSDESKMFRDDTFRGAPIANVVDTFDQYHKFLSEQRNTHCVLSMTHQTMRRDQEFAKHIVETYGGKGLILGGHEHEPMDVTVTVSRNEDHYVRILKAGCDCSAVNVVDLEFDHSSGSVPTIAEMNVAFVPLANYESARIVQRIVDSHMSLLHSMEFEEIRNARSILPPGVTLSSVASRRQQTTVGGIICLAIKEELEVDVAMINGAAMKGNREYMNESISYVQLKQELPYPTKIVTIPMKRWQLQEAIEYSRTHPKSEEAIIDRRGFLQVDTDFDRVGFFEGGQDDDLIVALPRNLLNGFCEIKPLVEIGRDLKEKDQFPAEDDFIPAIDLVMRHFCKERWYDIVSEQLTFDEMDVDHKGFLSRDDVERMLEKAMGHRPPGFVIDDMIAAVDADENGVIDIGELSFLLAKMEREHNLVRFD
jgi:hypothetical protein